jgi:VIT1/CCC1 family predicted Fe2+/Mn2+ transporter
VVSFVGALVQAVAYFLSLNSVQITAGVGTLIDAAFVLGTGIGSLCKEKPLDKFIE